MNNHKQGAAIGVGDVFQLILIVLKLCGVIDWSWWWVLSPIWIGAIILIFLYAAIAACKYYINKSE